MGSADASFSSLDYRREYNSNTWGFSRKIGEHTFGDYYYEYNSNSPLDHGPTRIKNTWKLDDQGREKFRNVMRVITKILDIAGYIPGISFIAGIIRIIAASILGKKIERQIKEGNFVDKFADEARRTYKAQIERGIYEMIPVIGTIINLSLDAYWYRQWGKGPVGNLQPSENVNKV